MHSQVELGNEEISYALSDNLGISTEIETIRETYFTSCFKPEEIYYSDIKNFRANYFIFELGGKNKDFFTNKRYTK